MDLPTKPVEPDFSLSGLTSLFYGDPGVGKTTLVVQAPSVLLAATEPGARFLRRHEVSISTWAQFKDLVKTFCAGQHQYRTLGVDTLDRLYMMLMDYTCKLNGVKHPTDAGFAKVWDQMKIELGQTALQPARKGYGLVFTSHTKTEKVETRTYATSRTEPTLSGTVRAAIVAACDIVGHIGFSVDKKTDRQIRVIRFSPSEGLFAKDKTGRLPGKVPFERKGTWDLLESYLSGEKENGSDNGTGRVVRPRPSPGVKVTKGAKGAR